MELYRDINEFSNNEKALIFLTSLTSFGYKSILNLNRRYGEYAEISKISDGEIESCDVLNLAQKREFLNKRKSWDINKYLQYLKSRNIKMVTKDEKEYPSKLLEIADSPFQLFYCGELPDEHIPSVSIIGARNCSEYGKYCAKYFAEELASKQIQIISGLASGIDGIAQMYAIERKGRSFGILGCGADICYPRSNWELFEKLKFNGGIITEFPPTTKPLPIHFPMRNRIISALADIVLVIEAKAKSGTAITVNMALEQGREVFAVPGRITDRLSDGCNGLIRDGAGVANDVDSILETLAMKYDIISGSHKEQNISQKIENKLAKLKSILNQDEYRIMEECRIKPVRIEELYECLKIGRDDITMGQINAMCLELEMQGYISNNLGLIECNIN